MSSSYLIPFNSDFYSFTFIVSNPFKGAEKAITCIIIQNDINSIFEIILYFSNIIRNDCCAGGKIFSNLLTESSFVLIEIRIKRDN